MIPTLVNNQHAFDVFISHASEDKEMFVRPLANMLIDLGLKVWYDEFSLQIGDSLRRSIDRGLSSSRYGIVVLSKNFFRKEWPQKELDGLMSKEVSGGKRILPIWHGVGQRDVECFSLILASKVAISSDKGLSAVVSAICDVVHEKPLVSDTQGHIKTTTLESFKKDAIRFINSDSFNNIVISAFPGLIECIARSIATLVMNICLDGFRAWQKGDATTIDCLDYNIQYFVERNTGVISTEPFSPNLIPWLKEIGSPIDGTLNELCDKYGLRRDIIVIPLTMGFRDIVDDKEEFGGIYLYQSSRVGGERDTFANGIALMIGVSLDIVIAIISGTLFIVLLFAALFWPGAAGILIGVIAVAFGGGSIVFIIQDKRTRSRGWNIPVWLRGILVSEQRYARQMRMVATERKTNLKPALRAQIRIDTVIQVLKQAINVRLSDIS